MLSAVEWNSRRLSMFSLSYGVASKRITKRSPADPTGYSRACILSRGNCRRSLSKMSESIPFTPTESLKLNHVALRSTRETGRGTGYAPLVITTGVLSVMSSANSVSLTCRSSTMQRSMLDAVRTYSVGKLNTTIFAINIGKR